MAETEDKSFRKDKCSVLLLLRVYLLEGLNKLGEMQCQRQEEALGGLASIIKYVANKKVYVEAVKKASSGNTTT